MSVTNYKIPCSYLEEGLTNDLYLVSASHSKVVLVDADNHAEITNLSEAPLHISCDNVEFNEESILDERYSFRKTITATIGGYANLSSLNDKYYAILKTKSGMLLMVNVDFPSDVSYTYTLSDSANNTVFTFSTLSNFPSLRLSNAFSETFTCKAYNVPCVKGLRLIGAEFASYSNTTETVQLFGDTFKDIDIYGKSLVFTENFNGRDVNTTITFNMPLWFYKSYWHINLLEFQGNKYRAVIEGCEGNYIYAGFNYGLIPSFTITGDDENSNISVTLTETSLHGSYFSDVFDPQGDTATTWDYVVTVSGNSYYECSDDEDGVGIYVLMAEVRGNGIRTGRYKVLEGHESEFTFLNVVGTFSDIVTFPQSDCGNGSGGGGHWMTDMTIPIGQCRTHNMSCVGCGNNGWYFDVPAGFTFTPSSGNWSADTTIEICNVSATVGTYYASCRWESTGNEFGTIILKSIDAETTSITPKSITANCNSQTVTFSFNASCPLTVTSIPASLTYTLGNSTLQVTIPANTQTTQRTFNITVKDCRNVSETVTIVQSGIYEEWRTISGEYVCQSGDKYTKERKYTGTTSSSLVATSETRAGTLIESGSTACSTTTYRWYDDGRFYCDGTTKYQALLEQVSYNGGETWNYTGNAKFGTNLGTDGTFCDGTETYTWTPTDKFDCYSPPHDYSQDYLTFVAKTDGTFRFIGNSINYSIDNGQTWVSLASNTNTPTVSAGSKIMWKASGLTPANSSTGIGSFRSTGQFEVEGNIMSLVSGDSFTEATTMVDNQFMGLFINHCTGLTSAEHLILNKNVLNAFCYYSMFKGCTSLTTPPELPVTTLASGCYQYMFSGCTSLTTAPELPATTLATQCYYGMFQDCTSLTTAPELPARTLVYACYDGMFDYCTSLNYIKAMFTTTPNISYTNSWVDGVASTGTFVKNASATYNVEDIRGADGIPSGWTVVEEEDELPIKIPEYLERAANANGYIGLGEEFGENTVIEIDFQMTQARGYSIIGDKMLSDSDDWRVFLNYDTTTNNLLNYDFIDSRVDYNTGDWSKRFHLEIGNYYIKDLDNNTMLINSTPKTGFTRDTQMYLFHLEDATQVSTDYGRIYSVKIKQNGTLVKDYIPWTDMEGNYGLYDKVANTIHQSTGQMTGSTVVNDVQIVQSGGTGGSD